MMDDVFWLLLERKAEPNQHANAIGYNREQKKSISLVPLS